MSKPAPLAGHLIDENISLRFILDQGNLINTEALLGAYVKATLV